MSKLGGVFKSLLLMGIFHASPVAAEPAFQCSQIDCDCETLLTQTLKTTCQLRQNQLQLDCAKTGLNNLNYCTFYGDKANRKGSFGINHVLETHLLDGNDKSRVALLASDWQTIYSATLEDLARLGNKLSKNEEASVDKTITQLQNRTTELLRIQRKLAKILDKSDSKNAVADSWRQFAFFMADSGAGALSKLENYKLMQLKAEFYEQAGYGFDQANDFDLASKYWKKAADASGSLSSSADKNNEPKTADKYRYLRSTQLHRARESWNKAKVNRRND